MSDVSEIWNRDGFINKVKAVLVAVVYGLGGLLMGFVMWVANKKKTDE